MPRCEGAVELLYGMNQRVHVAEGAGLAYRQLVVFKIHIDIYVLKTLYRDKKNIRQHHFWGGVN